MCAYGACTVIRNADLRTHCAAKPSRRGCLRSRSEGRARGRSFTVLLKHSLRSLARAKYALQTLAYDAHGGHVLIVRVKARRAFLTGRRMPVSHATSAFRRFGIARMHTGLFPRSFPVHGRAAPAAGRGSATGNGWYR